MGIDEGPSHTGDLTVMAAELRAELEQGWSELGELKAELKKLESDLRIRNPAAGEEGSSASVTEAVRHANQSWRQRRQRSLFLQTARRRLRR